MLKRTCGKAILFAAMLAGSLPALAVTLLYGTIGAGGGASTLVLLDPATGSLTRTIGSVGYAVNGMTWDATTNTLYATTSNGDATFPNGLITIDRVTGAGTPVGAGAGQLVNVPTADSSGQLFGWTESSDQPVRWNKAAGTITVLGGGTNSAEQSLAFDNNNVLYFLDCNGCNFAGNHLFTVNTTTGVVTDTGAVSGVVTGIAHHGDFNPDNNLLYAISRTGNGNNPRSLYVINASSRSVVNTLPTVNNLHTLAFVTIAELPVDNPLALVILALVVSFAGARLLRRRSV